MRRAVMRWPLLLGLDKGRWQSRSRALGMSVGVLAVAMALFVRLVLLGGLGTRLAYITLYPAVTIAAIAGGYRAGVAATSLSALAASLWLAPLNDSSDWLGMATFLVACALIVSVTEAMHRAQTRAAEAETEARLASAVRESEARLKAVVDTAVDGIITVDDKGIVQSFNPASERLFGYSSQAVIGRNTSLLMPEPHRGRHDQYLRDYLRTGQGKIIGFGRQVQGCRKDGTIFPIELAVSEAKLAGSRLFVGMVRDISERTRAEERQRELTAELTRSEAEARRQQALFEGVFNSAPEAIMLTDMARHITMGAVRTALWL